MAAEEHALLSASGSHRWLHCTPSARLEETIQDKGSTYAAEGKHAHKIAELRLRKYFTPMSPETYRLALEALRQDPLYQPEMEGHVETYFDFVSGLSLAYRTPPMVLIEARLDYSAYAQGGFGTGDLVMLHGDELTVTDFKYGQGVPVSADHNPQMMLYALGALQMLAMLYRIRTVRLAIVQPRLDTISQWTLPVEELIAWGNAAVIPLARLAWEGKGEYTPGDWCQFCRAKAQCKARSDYYLGFEVYDKKVSPQLTNTEIGSILTRAQGLATWLKDLESWAQQAILDGTEVPGWKVVEGRSTRKLDAENAIPALVAAGFDEALFYKRLPVAMGEMEKTLGKQKKLLEPYLTKPPGAPTLVQDSDPRPPVTRMTAEEAFSNPLPH